MGIKVSSTGEATGAPDTVELDVGVSVLAGTVAEATAAAAVGSQAVVSALADGGVTETDMTTIDYAIQPEYDYSGNQQRLVGYRVANTVRATVSEVGRAGEIVDAVSTSAGDYARIRGLSFSIANEKALRTAAREAAWNEALDKATQLARLSGQTLGKAISITETVRSPVVPVRMLADTAIEGATTPIQPGTSTVTVDLQVEFAFGE